MPESPYFNLIQKYFPESEWGCADCISVHECSPNREGYPQSCVANEGMIRCRPDLPAVPARSWGIFQILDACWNPDMNPGSPFTREQWAQVMDPEMNTWMASRIWSGGGWGLWSTRDVYCPECTSSGGPTPYPDGPAPAPPPPAPPPVERSGAAPLILGGLALMAGGLLLYRYRGIL